VDSADAARSGLPQYKASSGLKEAGMLLIGNYKFNPHWGVAGLVNYTRLLNDGEDSPLVKDAGNENQYKALVAVTYSF
jgi:outer membrane protein